MDLDRYCARIGYDGPREPTLDVLRRLHELHPQAIPFENLNPLLGHPVPLDEASLEAKLVNGRRGGWCFEQNWLFRRALEAMGFTVRGMGARVMWGAPAGVVPPRSHLVLEVTIEGEPFLADVGFGGVTQTGPLRFVVNDPQQSPHETYRLVAHGDLDLALEVRLATDWAPLFRFRREEQLLSDNEVNSFFLCHHPSSFFRRELAAARAFPGGRYALRNNRFTIYRLGLPPEMTVLTSAEELRAVLERDMTLTLPDDPALMGHLARIAKMPNTV